MLPLALQLLQSVSVFKDSKELLQGQLLLSPSEGEPTTAAPTSAAAAVTQPHLLLGFLQAQLPCMTPDQVASALGSLALLGLCPWEAFVAPAVVALGAAVADAQGSALASSHMGSLRGRTWRSRAEERGRGRGLLGVKAALQAAVRALGDLPGEGGGEQEALEGAESAWEPSQPDLVHLYQVGCV